jgi:prepilin-type N-terminal cleavage/methylation domain-containing protein
MDSLNKKNNITFDSGFSLIELLVVIAIIGILAALAVPNLMAARRTANEASAIATLRTISSAQLTYLNIYGGNIDFAVSGSELSALDLVDSVIGASAPATKSGYNFTITGATAGGGAASSYDVIAEPVSFNSSGSRSFYTNEAGVIYFTNSSTAGNRTTPGLPIQ